MRTPPAPPPTGSVVIATRNRPGDLGRCLMALQVQVQPPLEVIVVDDGSEPAVDADALRGSVPVRVLRTGGVGPATARNAGVHAATADVVIFTDDDTIPAPGDGVTSTSPTVPTMRSRARVRRGTRPLSRAPGRSRVPCGPD